MSTPYDIAGKMLCQYKFNVFPLKPKSKTPFDGHSWAKWQKVRVSEDQFDAWEEQFPGCNWANVCGQISNLVVFDCDDDAAYRWAIDEKHLPDTPFKVKTGKGWHLYYRYPKGRTEWLRSLDPKRMWGVNADLRRDGNYVVAPGSVHESGAIYTLQGYVDWETVPEFNVFGVTVAVSKDADLGLDLSHVKSNFGIVNQGSRNKALTEYVGGLVAKKLPEREVYKDAWEWMNISCKPPLDKKEFKATVKSVLRMEARNHPDGRGNKSQEVSQIIQSATMDGLKYVDETDIIDAPVPDCILNPPGVIKDVQHYILASSVRTPVILATAAAIALVGVLVGQKVISETGLVTNLITVCIGSSSCGKDAPKSAIGRILAAVAPGLLAGNDIASDAAMMNRLAQKGRHYAMWLLDEFGMFLQAGKKPNSPRWGVVKMLTELHSCPRSLYTKAYADEKDNKYVPWHCNSVFGVSVPNEFFRGLTDGEAVNGFLARMNIFIDTSTRRLPKKTSVNTEIPPELIEKLLQLVRIPVGQQDPVGDDGTLNLDLMPTPYVLPNSDEARVLWHSKSIEYDDMQAEFEEEGKMAAASIYGRISEHQMKYSLIAHSAVQLGNLVNDRVVTKEEMQWAIDVQEYIASLSSKRTLLAIASTDFEEAVQTVKRTIKRVVTKSRCNANAKNSRHKFCPGATQAQIAKGTIGYPVKMISDVLDKLVQSHELIYEAWPNEKEAKPGEKTKMIYRFVTDDVDSEHKGA